MRLPLTPEPWRCPILPRERTHLRSRPRKDHRGVNLISDALPFGRLWYSGPHASENAVDYAKFFSRSADVMVRVYDAAGNVIEMHRKS